MSNIYLAVLEVMARVGYVQKTGEMTHGQRYKFAGEGDLIRALRPAMIDSGIVMYPACVKELNQDNYMTSGSKTMNRDTLIVTFHFHHGESDTGFDVEVTGQGDDVGAKSANKAMTGAMKYALRQTFVIETGDDPDDTPSNQSQPVRVTTNGKPAADEPSWEKATFKQFTDYCVKTISRYDSPHAVKGAMKVLGIETWVAVGDNLGASRAALYADLKKYASFRDAGMDQTRSLEALTDDLMKATP